MDPWFVHVSIMLVTIDDDNIYLVKLAGAHITGAIESLADRFTESSDPASLSSPQ
jgi:hypothetical protein